ncbi:DUF6090 family protein [Portibacter marinus]|uniref:DUF6090 family protein n=1 Tax=Portibacter marinus TaxID=2898660 RepID=UPI001F15E84D|nr:DUF6090 family protein [Portibacter marinus]
MLKFFRKLRSKSLEDGKVTRYLKYAIGEIVLVVIGILIALQINNWNNDNQQRKIEEKYLREIKTNLEFDLDDIQFNIDFNESKYRSAEVVIYFVEKEIPYSDTLKFHFANLIGATRTLPNTSAYENLKSKGIEIISNDSLRQEITKLYSFTFHNLIDFEKQDDHPFQYFTFIPELSKEIRLDEFWKSADLIDQSRIFENHDFNNALKMGIFYRGHVLNWYKHLKVSVQSCISLIDEELKGNF